MKRNMVWLLLGCALGLPVSVYAVSQQYRQTPEVYYAPELFAEEEETEPVTEWEIYEPTPEELEEELYYDSLELLATLVYVEAGNQDMDGKRLVADVVLNRVDSEDFPDDIESVIYQNNAFSTVKNGKLEQALSGDMLTNDAEIAAYEESIQAVQMELEERLDDDILYFTAGNYGNYGTRAYQHGGHYFCTR